MYILERKKGIGKNARFVEVGRERHIEGAREACEMDPTLSFRFDKLAIMRENKKRGLIK